MKMRTLLSNTFFENEVSRLMVNDNFYSAASAGLDKHQPFALKENFPLLVYDSFLRKVTSRAHFLFIAVVLFEDKLRLFAYLFFSTTMI